MDSNILIKIPIPELILGPIPIGEPILETDSEPTIRNRFQKLMGTSRDRFR